MGKVLTFWRDDGISIPPRPVRIEPVRQPSGDGPPVAGFIMIYIGAFLIGVAFGRMFL